MKNKILVLLVLLGSPCSFTFAQTIFPFYGIDSFIIEFIYQQYFPLHAAAKKGDIASIKALIQAGMNVNALDSEGDTPLLVAALHAQRDAFQCLQDLGANLSCLVTVKNDQNLFTVGEDKEIGHLFPSNTSLQQVNNNTDDKFELRH